MVIIVLFTIFAFVLASGIGRIVVLSVTEPLGEVEKVAKEQAAGNLHSTLDYHSEDEIGSLAHNIRKSVRILGVYVDDISQRISDNAWNAEGISRNVGDLGDKIVVGNDEMKKMLDSMTEIRQTLQEISKIIAMINDIASQTNLLALNASIEAARARK